MYRLKYVIQIYVEVMSMHAISHDSETHSLAHMAKKTFFFHFWVIFLGFLSQKTYTLVVKAENLQKDGPGC